MTAAGRPPTRRRRGNGSCPFLLTRRVCPSLAEVLRQPQRHLVAHQRPIEPEVPADDSDQAVIGQVPAQGLQHLPALGHVHVDVVEDHQEGPFAQYLQGLADHPAEVLFEKEMKVRKSRGRDGLL